MQKLCRYRHYIYDNVNIVEISLNSTLLHLQTAPGNTGKPVNLQLGQTLQASVLSSVENGLINLSIGNSVLTASIGARLQAGQKLLLEVISVGEKPTLKIIQAPSQQTQIDAAIRLALPRQQPHQVLFKQLDQLLSSQANIQKLPEPVQIEISKLIQALPLKQTIIKPEVVQQAFKSSGLFLEAQLSQKLQPQNDFKVALLRLQKVIQDSGLVERPLNQVNNAITKNNLTGTITNPVTVRNLAPAPVSTTVINGQINVGINSSPQVTDKTAIPAANVPGKDTNASLVNRTINASTTLSSIPVKSLPVTYSSIVSGISQQGGVGSVSIPAGTNIAEAPFILPAHIPYRFHMTDTNRASERFSKLDSLSKLLGLFLKDAESSLARIQLNQLNQLRTEPEQKPAWVFDIPVRTEKGTDLFEFRIEQNESQKKEQEDKKTGWSIQVHFTLDTIGEIHSKISLFQKQVSITFWTENKDTQHAFTQRFSQLQQDLEEAGLEIEQLSCLHGTPPAIKTIHQPCKGILDEKI